MNVKAPSEPVLADQIVKVVQSWTPVEPEPPFDRKRVVGGIIAEAAAYHDVPVAEVTGQSKAYKHALARWRAMYRLRALQRPDGTIRYGLTQIAGFVGRKNHGCVLHGLRRYREYLADVGVDKTIAADEWAVGTSTGAVNLYTGKVLAPDPRNSRGSIVTQ